ncbi:MAG: glucose-6-phosphate isomerase [Spirochaetales bacterium]
MDLNFGSEFARRYVSEDETRRQIDAGEALLRQAQQGALWNDRWLGWFSVADSAPPALLDRILEEAAYVHRAAAVMVVIGIGGSNRGAMAAIDALHRGLRSPTRIVYAGDTMSGAALRDIIEIVQSESVMLNVIAKDFNTLEPGIAFRVLRGAMIEKYGADYGKRIIATGSRGPGQLFEVAQKNGYRFFDFPESIGGRFSVLSAVALFPMAVAGIDIAALVAGAKAAEKELKVTDLYSNPAARYAVNRNILFSKGFIIESLVLFEPDLNAFARWWTQLFAETEGKNQSAIFPTAFLYSEDLHAVGQYVQQGKRCVAETYLRLFHENGDFLIGASSGVPDGFDYLDGKPFGELNRAVYRAALEAHSRDGVPCLEISVPGLSERGLGELFYFFMFACYLSASLLRVNPFTQDGVENYKKNMYRLLGKTI